MAGSEVLGLCFVRATLGMTAAIDMKKCLMMK